MWYSVEYDSKEYDVNKVKNIIRYDDMVKDGDIVIPQDWDLTDEMLEMVETLIMNIQSEKMRT